MKNRMRIIAVVSGVVSMSMLVGTALAGSPAARQGDATTHGGVIIIGSPNVKIAGMSAARATDYATCPLVTALVPHVGGPIASGSGTVRINGLPAATTESIVVESGGFLSQPAVGAPTVRIGN